MRAILDKHDLIHILGLYFGTTLEPDRVLARAEPFEVELLDVELPAADRPSPSAPPRPEPRTRHADVGPAAPPYVGPDADAAEMVSRRADSDASVDDPLPGMDSVVALGSTGSPQALIAQSRELEKQLERERPRHRKGGTDKPPSNFLDEVR